MVTKEGLLIGCCRACSSQSAVTLLSDHILSDADADSDNTNDTQRKNHKKKAQSSLFEQLYQTMWM